MTTRSQPFRIDLHCHTAGSFDSRADPLAMARAAAAAGLTHLAITDHDTLDAALRLRDAAPAGITIIVGCEIHTAAGDLIAVFLERPVPPDLSPAETIDAVHAQSGLVGIPHPFDRSRRSMLRDPGLADELSAADWVEGFNARVAAAADNAQAAALAKRLGLPAVGVSDAHTTIEAGAGWTSLPVEPVTSAALRAGLAGARVHGGGGAGPDDERDDGGVLRRVRGLLRRSG